MDTVIVQLPDPAAVVAPGRAPELLRMGPGEAAVFGRGEPGRPAPIPLADQGVSRRAGEVTAAEDYWLLSNFSTTATYVVENLEGAGEHVKVAPGRLGAPVPFEFSRVLLPALGEPVSFKVFAPQHAYLAPGPGGAAPGRSAGGGVEDAGGSEGERTVSPFALDPTAKYFLVLLALCEPRLRSPSAAAVPGVTDVLARLRALPSCRGLTRSAVNYHIDYLVWTKLRLREPYEEAPGGGKREELAALALKFDLVREEHLALLPPRRP
ncbi:serine/threonine protein kinase [Kitasatospora sp. NPDC101176]|uniref:serine/threonine protein kinase n=1 Tax=Kitasatospora sp. NPDC101176 TaxID=3364099 RepID=UPI0037FC6B47